MTVEFAEDEIVYLREYLKKCGLEHEYRLHEWAWFELYLIIGDGKVVDSLTWDEVNITTRIISLKQRVYISDYHNYTITDECYESLTRVLIADYSNGSQYDDIFWLLTHSPSQFKHDWICEQRRRHSKKIKSAKEKWVILRQNIINDYCNGLSVDDICKKQPSISRSKITKITRQFDEQRTKLEDEDKKRSYADQLLPIYTEKMKELWSWYQSEAQLRFSVKLTPPVIYPIDFDGIDNNSPISSLDLALRIYHALTWHGGIHTVGDLLLALRQGDETILGIRNIGETSLSEIKFCLRERGLIE